MFFGFKPGTWWTRSSSDSRWSKQGRAKALSCGTVPDEVTTFLDKQRKALGEEPPSDLTFGFMKD